MKTTLSILLLILLLSCSNNNPRVAVLGDSLVVNIASRLNREYPYMWVDDFAIASQTSKQIVDRVHPANTSYFDILYPFKYDVIIVSMGMNDFGIETVFQFFRLHHKAGSTQIIYLSHWNFKDYKHWTKKWGRDIKNLDKEISQISGVIYIDLYPVVKKGMLSDGLHLNSKGVKAVANYLRRKI